MEPHERDVLERKFCTDDPSETLSQNTTTTLSAFHFSMRVYCWTQVPLVMKFWTTHTYVNSTRRNRIFFFRFNLPKHASPPGDVLFDKTYVNSTRRNRILFSDWPKGSGSVSDEVCDETYTR